MVVEIAIGDVTAQVTLKDIKNVHLSVHPPNGQVRISAPARMSLETIRVYAISRLGWIRDQQRKLRAQARETPREYVERESHYVWGRRYLLSIVEEHVAPSVELGHNRILLRVRPGAETAKREAIMEGWYRGLVREAAARLVQKWEPGMGVQLGRVYVQRMKTKWGSCNPEARTIRLNTELAKKPPECLEYIVVHEMVHLIERTHGERFVALMDLHMPEWRFIRDELNRLPVRHEEWAYWGRSRTQKRPWAKLHSGRKPRGLSC